MIDPRTIIRDPERIPSQDFERLRQAGLQFIEKLGSGLWTDFNPHDPGITLLEVLCYGITDLGYRTGHDIKDLLTRDVQGVPTSASSFHPAHKILTSGPVTFRDLRKMIVDVDGVRHAWVNKHEDVAYWLDKAAHEFISPKRHLAKPESQRDREDERIQLNGLYDVLVEFEEDVDELSVGLENNALGAGDYVYPDTGRMCFFIERDVIIRTVYVYADCPGNVTVKILDVHGTVHGEVTKYIEHADVKTPIEFNQFIYPPPNEDDAMFYMVAESDIVQLYRNEDVDYPFEVPGLIRIEDDRQKKSIKRNYFFFYDWQLDIPEPESDQYPHTYPVCDRVGLVDNRLGEGGYENVDGKGIVFDVEKPITIEEVTIYGDCLGTVEIAILDDRGKQYGDSVFVDIREPDMPTRVSLNCPLPICQNFKMVARPSVVQLFASRKNYYRNATEAFPYSIGDSIILIGGEHKVEGEYKERLQHTYYFFYDWKVTYPKAVGSPYPILFRSKKIVQDEIRERVLSCRNLGEDLVCIKELKPEEVGICADIELDPGVDEEEVLAEIYYHMEEHVKPSVKFYTLEELRSEDKNMPVDQIFAGPLLDNGFILDQEIDNIKQAKELQSSDIINLIMTKVEGVRRIKNLFIVSYIDGILESEEQVTWCPTTKECYVPNFEPLRTNITFFKNNLPVLPNRGRALRLLNDIRMEDLRIRNKQEDSNIPVPVPVGEDMEVGDYYPVQNDLPLNYYVGQFKVPDSASIERKAQARQLKAFLLFFEQLLANYLAQLENLPALLSWERPPALPEGILADPAAPQTYFSQPLNPAEIADLPELYRDVPLDEKLREFIESEEDGLARKVDILEHLVGRFAESFADYAVHVYRLTDDEEEANKRLLGDKLGFLKGYPEASKNRGKGYNYLNPEHPDSISGLKRRMYGLLGLGDPGDGTVACDDVEIVQDEDGQWYFVIKDGKRILFRSVPCTSKAAVETMLHFVLTHYPGEEGQDNVWYKTELHPCGEFYNLVRYCEKVPGKEIVGKFETMDCTDLAEERLKACANAEGLHVVEHILLRRHVLGDAYMDVQLSPEHSEGEPCPEPYCVDVKDPYSFRVSVILPAWPKRFNDVAFRRFIEDSLRKEAPAHVYLHICWIGYEAMLSFEKCVRAWRCELAKLAMKPSGFCRDSAASGMNADYSAALNTLIAKLQHLELIFPTAQLHDCINPAEDAVQVILGRTNLSTFGQPTDR